MSQILTSSQVVAHMANGQEMSVPIYQIKGSANGPKVYIQANMHGAEVQGNAVIYQLLEQLKQLDCYGDITLVPLANPIGTNQKSGEFTLGRFDPITGTNWNRGYHFNPSLPAEFAAQYPDLEQGEIVARFRQLIISDLDARLSNPYGLNTAQHLCANLQRMAFEADIVLDLHTGPISSRHLYCPEYAKERAVLFDIPHTMFIPSDFDGALDEAAFCPWWQLQLAYQAQGREIDVAIDAFTLELGSQEWLCLEEAKKDCHSVLSYLSHQKVIEPGLFSPSKMTRYACYLNDYRALYAPKSGLVEYLVPFGEEVKAGQPLARILRMDRYGHDDAVELVYAPADCIPILHFASASVNQGTELYKVFTNYFTL
ncbi:succinylglutamate desuccinylase/aspartoacylase family protein [Psychrobium sp. 1_MG-2023]|uniref:succinylglutamate desuccinylase/aspartoacylase family protein n=1 Tax=Psychrobium sp. 1_MG-2023 TaxID=3062624 RepID=UPI000C344B76|nr:succinylglutamate desuccinylase/aspartoacylase family protein [Psychrobium sp. 1_MG-2023]MDP2561846.1 M14 family metallopeptidase [Psychrobium sp. 1_MG-2023]PKF55783.1 succinylglutamate desuccinylase [Alteromonadales bacterium alter-6D02]